MTKQKKPKTGDVVGWAVINTTTGSVVYVRSSRKNAREQAWRETYSENVIHRIGKIVLSK